MTDIRSISALIGRIYDAALNPAAWQDVLAEFKAISNAEAAAIQSMNPLTNDLLLSIDYGNDRKWIELLHTTYAHLCPSGPMLLLAEPCRGGSIFDMIDEQEYRETRFYNEWCRPQGFYDMAGAVLTKQVDQVSFLTLFGSLEIGRFPAEVQEFVNLVAPHVRRSITLAKLLEHQAVKIETFRGLIDRLSTAVVMVSGDARVLHANAAAARLLDGPSFVRLRGSGLTFSDSGCETTFRRALATKGSEPTMFMVSEVDGRRSMAAVVSLDARADVHAIFLHQPAPDLPAAGRPLVEAFGFTPREIAVVIPLLQGKDITEVAQLLGISVATARTHLQRLFEKTKTSRQADLVRVVMQIMPPVMM